MSGAKDPRWKESDAYLRQVPVSEMTPPLKDDNVIAVSGNNSVGSVLHRLVNAGILAAPLRDGSGSLQGFVTIMELVAVTVNFSAGPSKLREYASSIENETAGGAMTIAESIQRKPIRHELHILPSDCAAADAFEIVVRTGTHRIGIVDKASFYSGKHDNLVGILTQASLVKFLSEHRDRFQRALDVRLERTRFYKDVISIDEECCAWEALQLMSQTRVSGVGVTAVRTGKLIGQITIKDLRASLSPRTNINLEDFALPAREFLKRANRTGKISDITCTPKNTLNEVLDKLAASGSHRVFCVDADGCAIGVSTVRDIVQETVEPAAGPSLAKSVKPLMSEIKVARAFGSK